MPSRMPIDAQCNECTYLNNPGGEGRPSSIAAASATEEVAQSGSVPRDPLLLRFAVTRSLFRYYPSLVLSFVLSFFLLTLCSLGKP